MALFKDIADFCTVYPAMESASWPMLKPMVERIERTYLRDQVLGATLYNTLNAAAQTFQTAGTPALSAPLQALYDAARPFLANMTVHDAAPKMNTLFTSGGLTQLPVEKRAAMWATNQRRAQDLADAYTDLNNLIDVLIAGEAASYTGWSAAAPVGKQSRASLVPSMTVAQQYLPLHGPWLLHMLRPAMRKIQTGEVKKILGDTVYDALLAAVVANNASATQLKYLDEAIPAILNGAIADQIIPLGLTIDKHGVWNWQATSSGSSISGGEQVATDKTKNAIVDHHAMACASHLEELRKLVAPSATQPSFPSGTHGGTFFTG